MRIYTCTTEYHRTEKATRTTTLLSTTVYTDTESTNTSVQEIKTTVGKVINVPCKTLPPDVFHRADMAG